MIIKKSTSAQDSASFIDLASSNSSIEFISGSTSDQNQQASSSYLAYLGIDSESLAISSVFKSESEDSSNSLSDFISKDSPSSSSGSSFVPSPVNLSVESSDTFTFDNSSDSLFVSQPTNQPTKEEQVFKPPQSININKPVDSFLCFSDLSLYSSDSLDSSSNSQDNTNPNSFILETHRLRLNKEWREFDTGFKQQYPFENLATASTYYQLATKKRLAIVNEWWILINKFPASQPQPPLALTL